MTWSYKPPSNFRPEISAVMEACLRSPDGEVRYYYQSEALARTIASEFRRFRWCIRSDKAKAGHYWDLEHRYDYRTKVMHSVESGWFVRIISKPARLSDLFTLNPWLANIEHSPYAISQ